MKILIVDDIKGWRDYHTSIVTELLPEATIYTANSAKEAYNLLFENNEEPFDVILTDMQMENDYEPKYAGEWLIEQIKTFKSHTKSQIIIISAAYNISHIAETYGVEYIRKSTARNFPNCYNILKNN